MILRTSCLYFNKACLAVLREGLPTCSPALQLVWKGISSGSLVFCSDTDLLAILKLRVWVFSKEAVRVMMLLLFSKAIAVTRTSILQLRARCVCAQVRRRWRKLHTLLRTCADKGFSYGCQQEYLSFTSSDSSRPEFGMVAHHGVLTGWVRIQCCCLCPCCLLFVALLLLIDSCHGFFLGFSDIPSCVASGDVVCIALLFYSWFPRQAQKRRNVVCKQSFYYGKKTVREGSSSFAPEGSAQIHFPLEMERKAARGWEAQCRRLSASQWSISCELVQNNKVMPGVFPSPSCLLRCQEKVREGMAFVSLYCLSLGSVGCW